MTVLLWGVSDYKLTELLSSAGATIGVIISGTIFLQFMSTKFIELTGRYRELAAEYRAGGCSEVRHSLLQSQIRIYRRRLRLMNRASWLAAVALLCFLAAVMTGGVSMVFPWVPGIKVLGAGGLLLGLFLMACAVALELRESILSRYELGREIGDLDDPVKGLEI